MPSERKAKLDSIGFIWKNKKTAVKGDDDADWDRMYEKLKMFKEMFGHVDFQSVNGNVSRDMVEWANEQIMAGVHGKLSSRKRDLLRSLGLSLESPSAAMAPPTRSDRSDLRGNTAKAELEDDLPQLRRSKAAASVFAQNMDDDDMFRPPLRHREQIINTGAFVRHNDGTSASDPASHSTNLPDWTGVDAFTPHNRKQWSSTGGPVGKSGFGETMDRIGSRKAPPTAKASRAPRLGSSAPRFKVLNQENSKSTGMEECPDDSVLHLDSNGRAGIARKANPVIDLA